MFANPWFLALRPKTLTAALVPVMVATALVSSLRQPILWWVTACAVLSAIFIQIGTNFVNDALDFKKGADTEERVGPKRVTQSGLLTYRQVLTSGFISFLIAMILGVPLVVHGGWVIVVVGVLSLICGYTYTGGPFPLAYRGLGDFFVIIFFGLVAVAVTTFLHTMIWPKEALVAGLQIGLLATVLIAINNFRDRTTDAKVGKRTLAVRFGDRFARIEITLLCWLPFLLGAYWWEIGLRWAAVLPFLALPLAWRVTKGIWKEEPGEIYNRFLALSAGLHLLFGIGLSIGLFIQ